MVYGQNLEIRVKTSGKPVENLYLVARTKEKAERFTMFLAPDRSYFQTLASLRQQAEGADLADSGSLIAAIDLLADHPYVRATLSSPGGKG